MSFKSIRVVIATVVISATSHGVSTAQTVHADQGAVPDFGQEHLVPARVETAPASPTLFAAPPSFRGQAVPAPPPPQPEHTGFVALLRDTGSDFARFPRRRSTWVILGIGGGAAALVHPWDDEINNELQEANTLKNIMKPGKFIGYAWVQGGAALGMYFIGRYAMEPEQGTHTNRVAHLGFDLLRANIVSQALTYGIKGISAIARAGRCSPAPATSRRAASPTIDTSPAMCSSAPRSAWRRDGPSLAGTAAKASRSSRCR
jgi:hypothetical protein